MNAKQAKDLQGKYGLFQIGDRIYDSWLTEISPSGNFVCIGGHWQSVDKITFVEALPELQLPMSAAANVLATDVAQTQLAAAPATTTKDTKDTKIEAASGATLTFPTGG